MGSLFGGSQESSTEVPQFQKDAGEFGVNRARQIAERGYMPYFGPDVAALTPQQYQAMQGTQDARRAFGMSTLGGGGQGGGNAFAQGFNNGVQVNPMAGLPAPGNFGGISGYSGAPIYQGAMDQLEQRMPGLMDYHRSMFIDPQTGAAPTIGNSFDQATSGLLGSDDFDAWEKQRREMNIERW